ncbi:apolipoprotein N-acyltransferase [Actinopolyspora xinjiangensis]|uniref:apolipoprotein N-acyltransferase n=1 Tax=Actinopolyspora xinjiangensis TaxID=405564 RepID=UPI001FCD94B8|nr:apolipoprotein N-acyltransferase [Actinopolyspora xinjiangensis]
MVIPRVSPGDGQRSGPASGRGVGRARRTLLARLALVVSAGLVLYWSGPPRDLWWLAPLAVAGFVLAVRRIRARAGFGYGLLFGLAYTLPLLGWLLDFLGAQFGPWPWLGVCLVESLFFGLAGAGAARVSRLPGAPLWQAAVFLTAEVLRSSLPFGGFPWGRLAFTQTGGVLLPLASLGGTALVGLGAALVGAGLAETLVRLPWFRRDVAARSGRERRSTGRGRLFVVPLCAVLVPVLGGLAVLPTVGATASSDTATVAAVQGSAPNVGLDLLYRDRQLRLNHIRAARRLADDVAAGRVRRPDFVLLPEQVGSWGPERRDPALRRIAERIGSPVIVGGLAYGPDGRLSNRIVRWGPETGASGEYVKQHLVPFAEKIPLRSVAGAVSPFVRRFQQDMVAGDEPGLLRAGSVRLGVGICYDVAYDDVFRQAARAGANLFALPTNNAWYGHSEMSHQQLAMARLRAVEHGRSMVVAATTGVSAVVRPDGSVKRRTEQFTAETVVSEVPLRSSNTVATFLGRYVTWLVSALGVGAVLTTSLRRYRDRAVEPVR